MKKSRANRKSSDTLLGRSLFIDPPDAGARLWAIDVALRSPATALVVADGSGLDMGASRRLQLAAEAGLRARSAEGFAGGGIALLARPEREMRCLSAALARWRVAPVPAAAGEEARGVRWRVELTRSKGSGGGGASARVGMDWREQGAWRLVELDCATGRLCVPADVADRSVPAPGAREPGRREPARRLA